MTDRCQIGGSGGQHGTATNDSHDDLVEYYESLSPEERRERVLWPVLRDLYNEITLAHRIAQFPRYFLDKWAPILGPVATAVYLQLRQFCYFNRETDETRNWCWPSQATLARQIGVRDRATVRKGLERLERYSFIRRESAVRRNSKGQIQRTSDKCLIFRDLPLTPEDTVEFLARLAASNPKADDLHMGKEPSNGEFSVDNSDQEGRISAFAAGEKVNSGFSTEKNNDLNVRTTGRKKISAFRRDPRVSDLTPEERARKDDVACWISSWLLRKMGKSEFGIHPSHGMHRRIAYFMPEELIRQVMRDLEDRLAAVREGTKSPVGDLSALFFAYIRRVAEQNGIDLKPRPSR